LLKIAWSTKELNNWFSTEEGKKKKKKSSETRMMKQTYDMCTLDSASA
jgi:hypothetical protein